MRVEKRDSGKMKKATKETEWNQAAYEKKFKIARGLTSKGIRIALNQADAFTDEVKEAYFDVLRERGEFMVPPLLKETD
jgi:hypothetical protein